MSLTWKFRSELPGVSWPAVTGAGAATALALQYQLAQTQWWPPAELERQQFRQLGLLLKYAYHNLHFWRRRLKSAGFIPTQGITPESFRALPILTRADVQASGAELVSRSNPSEHGAVTASQTSGSTGRPIVSYENDLTQLFWRAFTLREHVWHARNLSGKLAAIRTAVETAVVPGWGAATDLAFETGPSVTLNIRTDIDTQLEWLQTENPDYLLTYPSNLHALATRALAAGIRLPRLRQTRTYGESLPADLCAQCERAWQVPLADIYSAQEVGYIALQCPRHEHYHVQSENLLVEILDDADTPCEPGQIGRVVVTALHNFAMPLIRYEIGDYAEAGPACACGRGLPVLQRILGRVRNIVTLPDGRRHWASFPSSQWRQSTPAVTQLQIVQKSPDMLVLRVVASRVLSGEDSDRLIAALRDCLGHPFAMVIEQVSAIPRSASLKFEEFMSEII